MVKEALDLKGYFLTLTFIHAALISGQVFFGFIAYFLVSTGGITFIDEATMKIFRIIVPLLTIISIGASYLFFRMQLNNAKSKQDLSEKLMTYRTALIIKWAFLETPSILAIVGYLITGNRFFIIIAGLIILVFLVNKPSRNSTAFELELSRNERGKIDNPNNSGQ